MLTAASFGMMQLMKPLKWSHLQVPLVPVSMMNELIHYPAPFVLGCPTDEKESVSILNALPSDVTLIDLDVGRVILASDFTNDASKSIHKLCYCTISFTILVPGHRDVFSTDIYSMDTFSTDVF